MSDKDKNDDPAPTDVKDVPGEAAVAQDRVCVAEGKQVTNCKPGPKRPSWSLLEKANLAIAVGTVLAALASTWAVVSTTGSLKDQSALDVLAGFGTSEVVQAKMSLFEAAGEIDLFRTAGIEKLAAFEVSIAPLRNQVTLTALCMGMGRCVEPGVVELFCDNAQPLDRVLTAIYAQTDIVPRPPSSAAFTKALARCKDTSP